MGGLERWLGRLAILGRAVWGRGALPGGYDTTQFVTYYSGKVLANLGSPEGGRMRCRFLLFSPAAGIAGGGQGECQLQKGRTINATFDPS